MPKDFAFERTAGGARWILRLKDGRTVRRWLVTRGPSLDPSHRRPARELPDDEPVGPIDEWDTGPWKFSKPSTLGDDELTIELRGSKLHGAWHLARKAHSRWNLIKAPDDFAVPGADVAAIDAAFATLPMKKLPKFRPLALATLADAPPDGASWIHEVKLDGYRIEAVVNGSHVQLFSRNAKDWTARFPHIAAALQDMSLEATVLDGEVIAVDEQGATSFQQLQQSLEISDPSRIRYFVFDVLASEGVSHESKTLEERLPILDRILGKPGRGALVQRVKRFDPKKGDVLEQACRAGEEGVISKKLDARYSGGRSRHWIKSKCGKRQEFIIVGFTDPQGARTSFGSLLLAVNDTEGLRYVGRVGTGFDTTLLRDLYKRMKPLEVRTMPVYNRPGGIPLRTIHWVRPTLVGEVAFTEWTADGMLRHPSFKGLREDKRPADIVREEAS